MKVITIGRYQFNALAFEGLTQKQAVALLKEAPAEIVKQAWKEAQPILKAL
jgi:hypothetical protein